MRVPFFLPSSRLPSSPKPSNCRVKVLVLSRGYAKRSHDATFQSSGSRPAGEWPHPIFSSAHIVHHKSGFQAHATAVRLSNSTSGGTVGSVAPDLKPLFVRLVDLFPRTKRATHRMYAWCVRSPPTGSPPLSQPNATTSGTYCVAPALSGSSDGGESGAGERLDRLLTLSGSQDVVVVVYRWYGGVQLGSGRWKCISGVAKEALRAGSFIKGEAKEERASGRCDKGKR